MMTYIVKSYATDKILHTFTDKDKACKYKEHVTFNGVRAYIVQCIQL